LFKFGKWVTGVSIMTFFILQGDALFVSGYFGTAALAFYTMSIDMATTPAAKITSVIGTVAFPAFARLQEKRAEMVALFEDSLRAIMLIAGPISIVIYAIVPDIVFHVIDEKWAPIIPLVRVLVVAGCLRAMVELGGPLFQAVGRGDLDFRMNLTRFLCTMLLVWPACAYGGLKAVAVVAVLGIASGLPIWFYGVKKILGLSPWYIIKSNILPCVCTATLGGTYALSRYAINGSLLLDLASSVVAIGLWIGIMALMGKLTPLSLFKEVQRLRHSLQAR
ncbi:MAG: oligosaccharide flippase family protein, partial [Polyangiaceae bacterium]|nr:oligosaccharide flippase family protein [Polyangiaceae bacterium]